MASPTTPTHGKYAALYRMRPNNFQGDGLNDLTWGASDTTTDSSYIEVEIDAEGTPDTFRWRENGGGWNAGVAITGASQALAGANGNANLTFAATTGHTLGDQWTYGWLKDEPTTEAGAEAQITDTSLRFLNPNARGSLVWTDDGGELVKIISWTEGKATFFNNVGNVTVTGDNGFILESGLEKVGYLQNWTTNFAVDMADASRLGQHWKEAIPGQAGGTGNAEAYFIGIDTFYDSYLDQIDGSTEYFFIQFFNYDPDQDQTGDHFNCWVCFDSWNTSAPIGEVVKESINFQLFGELTFTANT